MNLYLIRKYFLDTYTIGSFRHDDLILSDTLEDRVRNLEDYNHDGDFDDVGEGKIYGQTAIPCGTYGVIVSYSPKLKRRLPLLIAVPGFTGIRIHAGENAGHTEGCILVGENKVKGGLVNGRYHEAVITNLIEGAIHNGEKVYLTIKE